MAQHGATLAEPLVSGDAVLQAALVTERHRLPKVHDGQENDQLAFTQRQRLGDEFPGVIILHIMNGFAQLLQYIQPFQAIQPEAVEFVHLGEQQAVRNLQVGQLQLVEPL